VILPRALIVGFGLTIRPTFLPSITTLLSPARPRVVVYPGLELKSYSENPNRTAQRSHFGFVGPDVTIDPLRTLWPWRSFIMFYFK
jgi:hypothetical protein